MKALVLKGKKEVSYEEVKTPKCPNEGMLIKMEAVGLCGSDIRTYNFGHPKLKYPAVLGHEDAGEIVEIGKEATTNLKVGQRVLLYPNTYCGKCYFCERGIQSLCLERFTYGSEVHGGFAEFLAIPKEGMNDALFFPIPKEVKSEELIIAELLSSAISCQKYANVSMGESVVIIGSGPLACLHSEVARLRGAKKIIIIGRNEARLEMSKGFSATDFINSTKEDRVKKVLELTDGFGADVVIISAPSGEPAQDGLKMLRKQGRLVLFGGLNKDDPMFTVDANLIHYNELTIMGAYGAGIDDYKKAVDLISNNMLRGKIKIHTLPLKDMEKGVALIKEGKAQKIILKP